MVHTWGISNQQSLQYWLILLVIPMIELLPYWLFTTNRYKISWLISSYKPPMDAPADFMVKPPMHRQGASDLDLQPTHLEEL